MENGMNSPITGDHPILSNDTNTRRREKNREKRLLKNNLKTDGNKGVNRQKLVEENPNLSDGTGENGCETNKRSLKESYNIKKKLEIDEMSPSEDLLKNNLKTGGNKGINRQRLVEENPNLSDGTGENGCETNKKSLKESYNIKKKLEIDEMSPLEDRNSKLDGKRGKKLKNRRSKGLLKPSDMAAEEQEENGENISELNPKSRYSRVDNGINVTENVLSKEAHKSGAEQEVSIVSLLNEGKPESNNENSERHKSKKKQRLLEEAAKADQRGVCYLSRIPPHMDPVKLRQILSQYGEIQRIYLSPEESTARVPRKRTNNKQHGGFQEQSFSEGWVEFSRKSVAKRVASMLNGEQIGGRKKSSFYYDLWNIKYLRKFKWDDLTEEIAYKNAIREQKLALEISAAKRERDFYLSKVDQSRALSSIEERIKKKQKLQQDAGTNSELPASQELKKVFRQFPQKQPVADNASQSKPRLSKDILAGVFGDS